MSETPRTESRNPRAAGLATATTREILALMNDEDASVAAAVRQALPDIERAVDRIVAALAAGGHVRYVGAGTSGRLGVLDASEVPPTFGVATDLFHGIIAGGDGALRSAVEGAEDSADSGRADLGAVLAPHDVIVGISASGRAPYVPRRTRRGASPHVDDRRDHLRLWVAPRTGGRHPDRRRRRARDGRRIEPPQGRDRDEARPEHGCRPWR